MVKKRLTADERREKILETATRLFAINGYDNTSTRELAKACDVNISLIYQHFPTKEDLYYASVEYKYTKILEMMDDYAAKGEIPPGELFRSLLGQIHEVYSNPLISVEMWHNASNAAHDLRLKNFMGKTQNAMMDFCEMCIKKEMDEGRMRSDIDPAFVAYWLRAIQVMSYMIVQYGMDDKIPESRIKECIDSLLMLLQPVEKQKTE
jgi:AcrR family transcriptional regulator